MTFVSLQKGASLEIEDSDGNTPLSLALREGHDGYVILCEVLCVVLGVFYHISTVSRCIYIREVVKPILKQVPSNHGVDGGLCLSPFPQPQKVVFLLHSHPSIQQ